jgi:small subunit ribosomal protein S24e
MSVRLGFQGKTLKVSDDMSVSVLREFENKLLSRVEVELHIEHITRGTPSRKEVQKIIASLYKVPEDTVIVRKIMSEYGRGSSKAHVNVYLNKDVIRILEPKYVLKRLSLES